MKNLTTTLAHAFAALGLAGAAISPAFADTKQSESVNVSVDDLDLATAEGQLTLERRIDAAVRQVCRDVRNTGTRIKTNDKQVCIANAKASIREQLAARGVEQQRGG